MNLLTAAIETVGLQPLADACKVTYQAVRKWEAKERLPSTEATGETEYASIIERETRKADPKKVVTREALMRWSFPDLPVRRTGT
jgi:phage baseplate assembly protein W